MTVLVKAFPAVVNVCVPLPLNVKPLVLPPAKVWVPYVKLPKVKKLLLLTPIEIAGLLVTPLKLTFFPRTIVFRVIVLLPEVIELLSNITSSCGSGAAAPDAPPDDVDQLAVSLQFPPVTPTQYRVLGLSKVILLFPPQSPSNVPVKVPAAPAPTISSQEVYARETAAAVRVLCVPSTELFSHILVVVVPLVVSSVVIV